MKETPYYILLVTKAEMNKMGKVAQKCNGQIQPRSHSCLVTTTQQSRYLPHAGLGHGDVFAQ